MQLICIFECELIIRKYFNSCFYSIYFCKPDMEEGVNKHHQTLLLMRYYFLPTRYWNFANSGCYASYVSCMVPIGTKKQYFLTTWQRVIEIQHPMTVSQLSGAINSNKKIFSFKEMLHMLKCHSLSL